MCVSPWWQAYFFSVHRSPLMLISWICERCWSSSQLTLFFSKIHVENNPYRGSQLFFVLNCVLFSEPSCIYIRLAGMKFIFDKSHVVHKGFHDHFNPQVFMNKQGGQTIDVCGIERQPRRYDVVKVKIHVRPYDVVYVKVHVRRYDVVYVRHARRCDVVYAIHESVVHVTT